MLVNGVEVDGSTREDWQKILLIFRSNLIFSAFIKGYIRFMKQMQQMKKLKELLMKSAFVHSLHHFQMGYTKELEKVDVCYGGQEQRVAMARAL